MIMTTEALARVLSRRGFLSHAGTGLAGIALAHLLADDLFGVSLHPGGDTAHAPGVVSKPHFSPKARQVLHLFCPWAASHMDLWDYKPALEKFDGTPLPGAEREVTFQGKNGNLMRSPWPFRPYGQSGKRITSLLPHMARHVDDIAFIHSMTSRTNTHGP